MPCFTGKEKTHSLDPIYSKTNFKEVQNKLIKNVIQNAL